MLAAIFTTAKKCKAILPYSRFSCSACKKTGCKANSSCRQRGAAKDAEKGWGCADFAQPQPFVRKCVYTIMSASAFSCYSVYRGLRKICYPKKGKDKSNFGTKKPQKASAATA